MSIAQELAAFSTCLVLLTDFAFGNSAFVRADEIGQGILRQYDDRCYIFVPAHVLGEPWQVDAVLAGGSTATFDVRKKYDPDIGIAETKTPLSQCPKLLNTSLDVVLNNIEFATLQIVLADGTVTNSRVDVLTVSDRYLNIKPTSDQFFIAKGMSGSAVVVNGAVIGQLQSVDSVSGVGKVIRLDYLLAATQRFFDAQSSKVYAPSDEPVYVNSSIDPNLIVRGNPGLVVNGSENKGVSFWWQETPVFLDISIGGKPYTVTYQQNRYSENADKPIKIELKGNTGQGDAWFTILNKSLPKFENSEITIGDLPSGLTAIRVQFSFSADVRQPTIGSLRLN